MLEWLWKICLLQETILVATLVALGAVLVATWQRGAPLLFDLHPLLMTVAYGVLTTWSIWSYLQPFLLQFVKRRYDTEMRETTPAQTASDSAQAANDLSGDNEPEDTTGLLSSHQNTATADDDSDGVVVYPWPLGSHGTGSATIAYPIKREQARDRHRTLNIVALICASGGLLVIVANKLVHGKTIWPQSLHAYIGFATLIVTIVQVFCGLQKYSALGKGDRIYKWHGQLGKLIYLLGNASVVLGIVDLWGLTPLALLSSTVFCIVPLGMVVMIQKANGER